jgi:hypothetical protein
VEILRYKNIYKDEFPRHTVELIADLRADLGVDGSRLDAGLLKDLDSRIIERPDAPYFLRRNLMALIGAVGEVLIREFGGTWYMEPASDGETWNPFIIVNGRKIQFFVHLYEDIYIGERDGAHLLVETYGTARDIVLVTMRKRPMDLL